MNVHRFDIAPHSCPADAGIRPLYPIDEAAWIWHPDRRGDDAGFYTFKIEFTVPEKAPALRLYVSADMRYELYCDDERIARGPDRGWLHHWTFSGYEVELAPGKHTLRAEVWWLGEGAPLALMTWRAGFILKADGPYHEALTTGVADWQVAERKGWSMAPCTLESYHVIGKSQTIEGYEWFSAHRDWVVPEVVRIPIWRCHTGEPQPGWKLHPSQLPAQIDRDLIPGRFVALRMSEGTDDLIYNEADLTHGDLAQWNQLLTSGSRITVPPNTSLNVIWDLETYYCAFLHAQMSGGRDARLAWQWVESLAVAGEHFLVKGQRDQVAGKYFKGFGHTFISSGAENQDFQSYWWTSGRFCRLNISTQDEPLTINGLFINETRYPLNDDTGLDCGVDRIDGFRDLCVRVLQMCTHESTMDCPYYEQMMYGGDTRLELLAMYMMTPDDRLPRRAIEFFDESRSFWGFATERCTSRVLQLSPTFSLIWTWMVHDYLLWRGDAEWVRKRMVGVRSSLECYKLYINKDGLLEDLPGWCFTDWVEDLWPYGTPPGCEEGVGCLPNLHYLLALQKVADIERRIGDATLAVYYQQCAERLGAAILATFWDEEKGLLKDDIPGTRYSEHAQCLLLLSGVLEPEAAQTLFDNLLSRNDLVQTSVYFRHYLFEVYGQFNRADLLLEGLEFWAQMKDRGFSTTVEKPEPSRSDCHAWGAHPLYHEVTTFLGLSPLEPGMKRISIAPQPAGLPRLQGQVATPLGAITVDLEFSEDSCSGRIILPEGMSGTFAYSGRSEELSGETKL